jgi:hypothetical protein
VSEPAEMDDRRAARRRALDGSEVEEVGSLEEIKAHDQVATALEIGRYVTTDPTAVTGDENAHGDRIAVPAPDPEFERSL